MGRPSLDSRLTPIPSSIRAILHSLARWWPSVLSNALEPGWAPTKMSGSSATDDLDRALCTLVWLAASDDSAALEFSPTEASSFAGERSCGSS